jgi:hypothetical protein
VAIVQEILLSNIKRLRKKIQAFVHNAKCGFPWAQKPVGTALEVLGLDSFYDGLYACLGCSLVSDQQAEIAAATFANSVQGAR